MTGKILAPLVGAGLGGAAMFALAFRAINRLQANEMAAKAEAYRLMNATARRGQTVFAGDSITEGYRVDEWFAGYTAETGQTVYNRGISAETSDQLLARWEDTVLALAPSRIVLLIGSNDLAKGTAPETVADNVRAMLAQAKAQDPAGRVTLLAVYPINPGQTSGIIRCALVGRKSPAKIARLNGLLAEVAAAAGAAWLDLTADLADATGALDPRLSHDGLHPNAAGYAVTTPRLVAALTT